MPLDVNAVRKLAIFRSLTSEQATMLARLCELQTFAVDQVLIRQGEAGDAFYVIVDGQVNVMRKGEGPSAGGRETFLTTLGPGDYFGEAVLFSDLKRTATVVAATPLQAVVITRTAFLTYFHEQGAAAGRILYYMMQQMFLRLDRMDHELQFQRNVGGISQDEIDKLTGGS